MTWLVDWVVVFTMWLPMIANPEPNPPAPIIVEEKIKNPKPIFTWIDIWPVHLHDEVRAIVQCESTFNPTAVGDRGNSLGLFQMWRGWFTPDELQHWDDPVTNSRVAYRVYQLEGFKPWTCARKLGIS